MIPQLSHFEIADKLAFWITTDSKVGTGFEITPCDLEIDSVEAYQSKLTNFLRTVSPQILSRISMKSESGKLPDSFPKSSAINELGFRRKTFCLYIETSEFVNPIAKIKAIIAKTEPDIEKSIQSLLAVRDSLMQNGIGIKPMSEENLKALFFSDIEDWVKGTSSVDTGKNSVGILRLVKPSQSEITESTLSEAMKDVEGDFELHVSMQAMDEANAKIMLERKLKQSAAGRDVASGIQKTSAEAALAENFKSGAKLFHYEFVVTIIRDSPGDLAKALGDTKAKLSKFGDFKIETVGCAPSFIATMLGSSQHVTLLESDSVLPLMFPLWSEGESKGFSGEAKRALTLYRSDRTATNFDLFDPSFNVFNSVLVGTSGKGKSVLLGLLTRSLLNDPNVCIIKVDVGGSHSKECLLHQGQEFVLKLDQPSGINPFEIINSQASDSDKIGILSRFLAVLIQEQGEIHFSKQLRSEIETSVADYIASEPHQPSLESFFHFTPDFPRRDLLARWVTGGLYANAFAAAKSLGAAGDGLDSSRLKYYNFSQVFQASDPEFAQAAIAAVLAKFNTETLTNKTQRIVLICDETPFFIKTCFDFFKFTTANVRKFGHAVILTSQLSTDLVVDEDTGVIENSPQRFLFSIDGSSEGYQKRFDLNDTNMDSIRSLKTVPKQYSQVLFQSQAGAKKLTVKVTPEEYWGLTTSQEDKLKTENLLKAVPGLTLREAITCLSLA